MIEETTTVVSNINVDLETPSASTLGPAAPNQDGNARGLELLPPYRILIPAVAFVCLCTVLSTADGTIIVTALPSIASSFNALGQITWVATSYMLTNNAFIPVWGKSCDLFGRKSTALGSCAVFIAGSVLCGASWDVVSLIIFRAIQGVGASGMSAIGTVIIADITPMRYRGTFLGSVGVVFAISSTVGPVIGGWITDTFSWRWCFYINVPLGLLALLLLALWSKESRRRVKAGLGSSAPVESSIPWWKRIDFVGTFLLVSAALAFLTATNLGGKIRPWSDPVVIVLYVLSILLVVSFYFVETRFAFDPVMPMRVYRYRTVVVGSLLLFATHVILYNVLFYTPNFLQIVGGYSATQSGLYLISYMVPSGLVMFISGVIVGKHPYYRTFIFIGFVIEGVAIYLLYFLLSADLSVGVIITLLLVAGIGDGLYLQMISITVQASIPKEDIAVCCPMLGFWGSLGGILGLAVSDAIVNASFIPKAVAILGPKGMTLLQSLESIRSLPSKEMALVIGAYSESVKMVFLITAVFTIIGLVLVPFMSEKDSQPGVEEVSLEGLELTDMK